VLQKTQKKQLLKGGRLPPENPFAIAKEKVNADDNGLCFVLFRSR
jgi:hypothetical protein